MPARPIPLILLLLGACVTGSGPDVADATASLRQPGVPRRPQPDGDGQ